MSDLADRLAAALADRYTIEHELGRGGMATVYLARDLRHDRLVALKVLHPELAATLGPERFLREIRFAARLQHPHILTVLESGEAAGQLWFTMPYVEGETLRQRLAREHQLPLPDALKLARETAEALEYAHEHGIVHRDIKPENILLAGRHALVADFGIARALGGASGGAAEPSLTQTGTSVGTPAYMSPEQASGDREVDARSDIYALGCVLYEMLAGEPPFTGPTAQAILLRKFTETPRPLRMVRDTVPEAVEQLVARALARSPADRFRSAGDVARALEAAAGGTIVTPTAAPTLAAEKVAASGRPRVFGRYAVTFALLGGFAIGLGVLFAWRSGRGAVADASTQRHIVVLPFENLGAPDDEYFADGMTDAVRGKLASVPGLQVIARTSSARYKKTGKTPQQVAQELGVRYILTATVRWEKSSGTSRVQVSPELVEIAEGNPPTTKWQQPFDATMTDVFQVQADIAGRVAQALDVALGSNARETIAERPTRNLAAYDAFLKGNEAAGGFITATAVNIRRAIAYYERAVAQDSSFALAWAQLSRAHSFMAPPTPVDVVSARTAAERARILAPGLPQAYLALGDYYSQVQHDFPRALEQFGQARKLAPNDVEILAGIALVERGQGHFEQSAASLRQALNVDPRSAGTARRLAQSLIWLKRYPEAAAAADRALALDPQSVDLNETKAMVLLAEGDLPGARAILQQATAGTDPTDLVAYVATYWDLFWVLDDSQQRLLLRLTPEPFGGDVTNWAICLAQTYALRGDSVRMRIYADSALIAGQAVLAEAPDDAAHRVSVGLAYAYLGRKADAIREVEKAVAVTPLSLDAYQGTYYLHQLARVYLQVGEPDKAIDLFQRLLGMPYYLSPAWLRIDPTVDPLRKYPRFQKLIGATS